MNKIKREMDEGYEKYLKAVMSIGVEGFRKNQLHLNARCKREGEFRKKRKGEERVCATFWPTLFSDLVTGNCH